MENTFYVSKVTSRKNYAGEDYVSVCIKGTFTDPRLKTKVSRTYYFNSSDVDHWKVGEKMYDEFKVSDFKIREFDYTIKETGKVIKLRALEPAGDY